MGSFFGSQGRMPNIAGSGVCGTARKATQGWDYGSSGASSQPQGRGVNAEARRQTPKDGRHASGPGWPNRRKRRDRRRPGGLSHGRETSSRARGQDARTPQGGGRARTSRTGKSPVEGFRHEGARMPASGMMRTGPENGAGRDRSLFAQERAARRHGRSGKHGCACRFGYEYRPASERSRAPRLKCAGIFPLFPQLPPVPQLPPAPACHSALPSSALPVRTFSFTRVSPAQDQTQP